MITRAQNCFLPLFRFLASFAVWKAAFGGENEVVNLNILSQSERAHGRALFGLCPSALWGSIETVPLWLQQVGHWNSGLRKPERSRDCEQLVVFASRSCLLVIRPAISRLFCSVAEQQICISSMSEGKACPKIGLVWTLRLNIIIFFKAKIPNQATSVFFFFFKFWQSVHRPSGRPPHQREVKPLYKNLHCSVCREWIFHYTSRNLALYMPGWEMNGRVDKDGCRWQTRANHFSGNHSSAGSVQCQRLSPNVSPTLSSPFPVGGWSSNSEP